MYNINQPIQVLVPKPFSSKSSPVVNLFKLSLELSSCTLSCAIVCANVHPETGVDLNPP